MREAESHLKIRQGLDLVVELILSQGCSILRTTCLQAPTSMIAMRRAPGPLAITQMPS